MMETVAEYDNSQGEDDMGYDNGALLKDLGTDATKWAHLFMLRCGADLPDEGTMLIPCGGDLPDEGTMVVWFANAIEAGRLAECPRGRVAHKVGGDVFRDATVG